MTRSLFLAAFLALSATQALAQQATIETSLGTITITLDAAHAPKSVANFVRYAKGGHYDGTVFYRVVPGFVIQAGSFDAKGNARPSHAPIPLESASGLRNLRGSIAMARTSDPNSATAEFFIDIDNLPSLDADSGAAPNTTGYAVFGQVTGGMDVVDKIVAVPTGGTNGPFPPEATPMTPVVIKKVTILDAPAATAPSN